MAIDYVLELPQRHEAQAVRRILLDGDMRSIDGALPPGSRGDLGMTCGECVDREPAR